ncbi:MAG: histidine kinase [Chitinophagaceae bacterium]|nr:histidine kinase [Chitinophagaceae bacterium]MDB5223580.1 histidine kinase [Chitinophagaceae bacterium]
MKKILIINNDVDTLNLLKSWLEKKEYHVKFTVNEPDVPDIINDFAPDLLLIDVLQAKVLKELKSLIQSKEIPVILMTGNIPGDQHKFINIADDVIEKPFEPKLLEKKINRFLKKTG